MDPTEEKNGDALREREGQEKYLTYILGGVHAVGSIAAFAMSAWAMTYMNDDSAHSVSTNIYTISSKVFNHTCSEPIQFTDDCTDHEFIFDADETLTQFTVTPFMGVMIANLFALCYHAFFAFNSACLKQNNALTWGNNMRRTLKSLRLLWNIMVIIPLVWAFMTLVGVGYLWSYIQVGASHVGMFALLLKWGLKKRAMLFSAASVGYLLIAAVTSAYLIDTAYNVDVSRITPNATVTEHFVENNLIQIPIYHTIYIFLFVIHIFLLKANVKFWKVQVEIGFAMLNVGYLLTISSGVICNYRQLSNMATNARASTDVDSSTFADDHEYYTTVQLAVGILATLGAVAGVVSETYYVRRWIQNAIDADPTDAAADYGAQLSARYGANAQPHEGEPILGKAYEEEP